jgi:hypothetical protein
VMGEDQKNEQDLETEGLIKIGVLIFTNA